MYELLLRQRYVETGADGVVNSCILELEAKIPFVPTDESSIRYACGDVYKMKGVYYCLESNSFWLELPDVICEDTSMSLEALKRIYLREGWVECSSISEDGKFLEH